MDRALLRKYFIMGSQNCEREPVEILKEAIEAGVTIFQFREKGSYALKGQAKVNLGRQLRDVCLTYDIPFIINDDAELVEILGADGIHVGQDDEKAEALRERYPDKIIGLSVSNMREFERSPIDQVDYVGAGPIFGTSTKEDAKVPVGTAWIKRLREELPNTPIVGIGGITPENAQEVIEAGADGVSVISAITRSNDISKTVQSL
ncbi:thiamine phosphate synthase [Tenuibacillus multivorans]|uniref:Thiamine-phosphate synthase n=1 Tax=Tenuibacillus multivorans TaxID=237069 RepID=A0A1H0G1U0_9BACI|nr:thiamine phosphate synthase [Tenuibacillus multivorans]GEL78121.1 thiamine-phosphate synthase [Tenuibacillus multivorans]SDO00709.1 thiamine-phosphate pyrophosphorylase [Tenuibacillus multivorans]